MGIWCRMGNGRRKRDTSRPPGKCIYCKVAMAMIKPPGTGRGAIACFVCSGTMMAQYERLKSSEKRRKRGR